MVVGMIEQGIGNSGKLYIFSVQMMTRNSYKQLKQGLCSVQSVRGILEQRVIRLITSVLQKGSDLLRSSLVQSSVRDVSAGSGVEVD